MNKKLKPPRDLKPAETKIICEYYDPSLDKRPRKKSFLETLFNGSFDNKNNYSKVNNDE